MKATFARAAAAPLVRLAGVLFLLLVPLVTLIPYEKVPVWLAQDLALRWGALLAVSLLAFGAFSDAKEGKSFEFDTSSLLLFVLAGWVLLSTRNSLQSFDSFYGFKSFLALLLWWFVLKGLWTRWPGAWAWFERTFLWTAVAASVWLLATTIGHKLGLKIILEHGVLPRQGLFPNQNIAAGFLGLFLVWNLLKLVHRERVPWAAFALALFAWGMTESRGALVAMILTIVIYLVLHMREIEGKIRLWRLRQWLWFGGTILLLLFPLAFMLDRFFHFLGDLEDDPRKYFRLDIWVVSWKMIMAQPLLGFGPNTFGDVFSGFRPGTFWNTGTAFAHNEYLQVAAECGLPAFFLLALLLVLFFKGFLGSVLAAPAFKAAPALARAGEAAFFLLLLESIHCLVDFTFHEWSHRLVLLAFVTRGLQGSPVPQWFSASLRLSRPAFWAGGAIAAILLVWVLGVGSFRDHGSKLAGHRAVMATRSGDLEGAEALARRSLVLRENFATAWDVLGSIEKAKGGSASSPAKREKHFRQADECFRKAISLSPYTQTFQEHQVQAMFSRGRLEQALDLQIALVERSPQLPNHLKSLALILQKLGRHQGALAAAQRSIELDHFYIPGYSLKGQSLMALGRLKDALATFEEEKRILERLGREDPTGQIDLHIKLLRAKLGVKD
jgi:O-antigen ligase